MQQAGVTICGGIDIDPACRYPFEANVNANFCERNVSELKSSFLGTLFPREVVRVLAGCAPCQPFSTYTNGSRDGDRQWQLLGNFGQLVEELQPEIVTMENVPRLHGYQVFKDFLSVLESSDYRYSHMVVKCVDYGVPQTRGRLVLLASKLGDIKLVSPTHAEGQTPTVRDTIESLEPIAAGGWAPSDPLHKSSGLTERNLERIRNSKPGGTWRDWDDDLRADCHVRDSGRTYPSVYGRIQWDQPAPTITTQFHGYGNGRFGHPSQDRAISLREGPLLQTFPEEYSFIPEGETVRIAPVARLIGNAVPVKLGEAIGKSIIEHLESLP